MTVNIFDPRIKFIQCQGQNMLLKIYMHDIVINNVTGTYKVLTDDSEFISRRRYQAQIMKIKFYSCSGRLLTLQSSSSISMSIILFILTICNTFFIHMYCTSE